MSSCSGGNAPTATPRASSIPVRRRPPSRRSPAVSGHSEHLATWCRPPPEKHARDGPHPKRTPRPHPEAVRPRGLSGTTFQGPPSEHHERDPRKEKEPGIQEKQINTDVALSRAEDPELHRILVWKVHEPCDCGGQDQAPPGHPEQHEEGAARDCRQERPLDEDRHSAIDLIHHEGPGHRPLADPMICCVSRLYRDSCRGERPSRSPPTASPPPSIMVSRDSPWQGSNNVLQRGLA